MMGRQLPREIQKGKTAKKVTLANSWQSKGCPGEAEKEKLVPVQNSRRRAGKSMSVLGKFTVFCRCSAERRWRHHTHEKVQ